MQCRVQVMRRIVDDTWQITYPPYISSTAKDLISKLLERRPARRIGELSVHASWSLTVSQPFARRVVAVLGPRRTSHRLLQSFALFVSYSSILQ